MNPFTVVLLGCLHPLALLAGLLLKWWAIWFALGRNFSRTSVLCLLAFLSSTGFALIILQSHATGLGGDESVSSDFSVSAWLVAFFLVWMGLSSIELWILRRGMRRMVRAEWSWRRSDLMVYQAAVGVWILLSCLPLLWRLFF
jgi:hypothetical protein